MTKENTKIYVYDKEKFYADKSDINLTDFCLVLHFFCFYLIYFLGTTIHVGSY